jgi:hypothetical protein
MIDTEVEQQQLYTAVQAEARKIFDRFKQLHPNSNEVFDFSLGNIARWAYHIEHAESMPKGTPVVYEATESDAQLIESRAVSDFSQLPIGTQRQYMRLVDLYPGIQLYATGSRIDGTYVDADSLLAIGEMRERIGKQPKQESDYDFTTTPDKWQIIAGGGFYQNFDLVAWSDDAEKQKQIPIPMWDFSKLPECEYNNVLALYMANNWSALVEIHDKYQLSVNSYCCDLAPVKRWYKWAITNSIVYATE